MGPELEDFLPNNNQITYHTRCFLTLAPSLSSQSDSVISMRPGVVKEWHDWHYNEMADCHEIDPERLLMTDKLRLRFGRAMRTLNLEVRFHLSELEADVRHPLEDKELLHLCSCREGHGEDEDEDFDSALIVESKDRMLH